MNLKEKQDRLKFEKINKLCKGRILNLGSSNLRNDYDLHSFLKEQGHEIVSVGLKDSDINLDLNREDWGLLETYDSVLASEIIEHLDSPKKFIRNCYEYLNKGGRFILSTPNATSLIYLYNPNWCVGYDPICFQDNTHNLALTSGMLVFRLGRVGFKNINSEYLNCFIENPLAYIITKMFSRLRGDILIWGDK